ncbi:MAG: hypothetical protein WA632_06350, partial [Gallionella sp.]
KRVIHNRPYYDAHEDKDNYGIFNESITCHTQARFVIANDHDRRVGLVTMSHEFIEDHQSWIYSLKLK